MIELALGARHAGRCVAGPAGASPGWFGGSAVALSGEVDDGRGAERLRRYRPGPARGPAVRRRGSVHGEGRGAKNPGKRGNFFDFRAAYAEPPQTGARISPVRITLPDGTVVTSGQADLEQILSRVSGRDVAFEEARPDDHSPAATAGEYWPDMPGLGYRDTVTDFEMPAGTFFDIAAVHRVLLSIDVARCSSSPARRLLNSTRSRAAGTNPITAIQGQTTDQAPAKA